MKTELGPLPAETDRELMVRLAEKDLHAFLSDWLRRHKLTDVERALIFIREANLQTKFAVAWERRQLNSN